MSDSANRIETFLLKILGPAQVSDPQQEPDGPPPEHKELLPGGYVRRGTPGHYYIVPAKDADED